MVPSLPRLLSEGLDWRAIEEEIHLAAQGVTLPLGAVGVDATAAAAAGRCRSAADETCFAATPMACPIVFILDVFLVAMLSRVLGGREVGSWGFPGVWRSSWLAPGRHAGQGPSIITL